MSNVLRRWVKSPSLDWTRLFSPHPSWPMSAFVPSLNDSDWSVNLQLTRSFRSSKKYFKSQNYRKWRQSRWIFWVYWLRELSRDKGRHARLEREKTTGTLQGEIQILKPTIFLTFTLSKRICERFLKLTIIRIIRVKSFKISYPDSVEVSILNFSLEKFQVCFRRVFWLLRRSGRHNHKMAGRHKT